MILTVRNTYPTADQNPAEEAKEKGKLRLRLTIVQTNDLKQHKALLPMFHLIQARRNQNVRHQPSQSQRPVPK